MSGHSKWANIKVRKGKQDAKRSGLFSKMIKEIYLQAKSGPDPNLNASLAAVIERARAINLPKENIERAIKRGAGGGTTGEELQEAIYEGYGPHGTAVIVETLGDNRNRTVSEVRRGFSRHGGNLGSDGCVAWMFSRKGYMAIEPGDADPDEIALAAIDAGAEDVETGKELVEIYTHQKDFKAVQEAMSEKYTLSSSELTWIPQTTMSLDEKGTFQTMKLIEALEELEDVQHVYSNLEISDEMAAKYEAEAA